MQRSWSTVAPLPLQLKLTEGRRAWSSAAIKYNMTKVFKKKGTSNTKRCPPGTR